MTRRRLLLTALAVLALGAAWCWFATGPSAEERRLVGTWTYDVWNAKGLKGTAVFLADGRCMCPNDAAPDGMPCWWSVRRGAVVFDAEPSRVRRLLPPVAPALGLNVRPVFPPYPLEVRGDRMVIYSPDGTPAVYTRAPPH